MREQLPPGLCRGRRVTGAPTARDISQPLHTVKQHSDTARQFWKGYWHGLYETPRAWAHKGENLVHAFEAVASASVNCSMHLNMHDQALMLAGMAIEVMLKAILVSIPEPRVVVTAPERPLDDAGKSLWAAFYSHSRPCQRSQGGSDQRAP